MICNEEIICFGSQDWDSHLCTPQQTMMRLAKNNSVLYIDLQRSFLKRHEDRYSKEERLREIDLGDARFFVYSPPPDFFPMSKFPRGVCRFFYRLNGMKIARRLVSIRKKIGFNRTPLLWMYALQSGNAIDLIENKMVIYDCIDDWAGYMTDRRESSNISFMDSLLCTRADIVFVGSRSLLADRTRFNTNTHFVPHAADFDLFHKAALPETTIPDDIKSIKGPIIGLVGVLEKRVHIPFLKALARSHPEWSIVLIGPVWDNLDVSPLTALANVHFLGKKPVETLPGYIKALDVCLIPYFIDDFTRNIYPLKLHEYFASGKPVVTTRIPACEEFTDILRIADTENEFIASCERAVAESGTPHAAALTQKRIETARMNTWDERIEKKSQLIIDYPQTFGQGRPHVTDIEAKNKGAQ